MIIDKDERTDNLLYPWSSTTTQIIDVTTDVDTTGMAITFVKSLQQYGDISKLKITLSLGPGSEDVDLSQLIIYLSDGKHVADIDYNLSKIDGIPNAPNFATEDYFSISPIRVRDETPFDSTQPVLRTGDVMEIRLDVRKMFKYGDYGDPTYQGLAPRTQLSLDIRPEVGALVAIEVNTPGAYFMNKFIQLRA